MKIKEPIHIKELKNYSKSEILEIVSEKDFDKLLNTNTD